MREKYSFSWRDDVFGRALLGERGEAAHVGEQHGHVPPRAAERRPRRIRQQLVVDVLRHVAREQLLDLALLAAFDDVLPRQVADEGEDDRQRRHGRAASRRRAANIDDGQPCQRAERNGRRARP